MIWEVEMVDRLGNATRTRFDSKPIEATDDDDHDITRIVGYRNGELVLQSVRRSCYRRIEVVEVSCPLA